MKIGIIGAGNVGGNLGTVLAANGHEVLFGVRDPQSDKTRALLDAAGPKARAGSAQDAAAFGDVLAVALRWDVLPEVLGQLGDLDGKVVIDCTNRFSTPTGGSANSSEDLARMLPGTQVVRAFNTIGAEHYGSPVFGGERASMFIAGDDAQAKAVVGRLAEEMGFEVVDAGPLASAIALESLTRAWVGLSQQLGRDIAFKLLRR
jgi:predicted dinucleotide-binding enzyme